MVEKRPELGSVGWFQPHMSPLPATADRDQRVVPSYAILQYIVWEQTSRLKVLGVHVYTHLQYNLADKP